MASHQVLWRLKSELATS